MSTLGEELLKICQELPPQKAEELVDFAKFLQQQARAKIDSTREDDDAAWERVINDPRPRPKLTAYAEKILKEEKFEPMDPSRL